MPNALTMIKSDHGTIKRLLREVNTVTAPKQREKLVAQLEEELKTHAQIEEEVFYPAFKARAEKTDKVNLFYEAAEEHHLVDIELPSLKAANPKSKEWTAKAKVLKELVEHHMKDEETDMFAATRQLFDEDEINELGDMMQARKDSITAMWENPLMRPVKKLQSVAHKLMPTKVKTAKATALGKLMQPKRA